MPGHCDLLETNFMYPENWELSEPVADGDGATFVLESPGGMFLSVSRYHERVDYQGVLSQAIEAMTGEYDEIEEEPFASESALPLESSVELNFYCQRYLVTARLFAIQHGSDTLLIQIQAESRDFDENEMVFDAMLKSLRDGLSS